MVSRICSLVCLCCVVEELSDIVHLPEGKGRLGVLGLGGYIDVAGEKVARMMGGLGEEKRREGKGFAWSCVEGKGWCRIVL